MVKQQQQQQQKSQFIPLQNVLSGLTYRKLIESEFPLTFPSLTFDKIVRIEFKIVE